MRQGKAEWKERARVALKSNPQVRGRVVQVGRSGRWVRVQFENYPRPTLHAVEGLILLASDSQRVLFPK